MRETDGTHDPSAGVGPADAEQLASTPRHRLLIEQLPLVTYVEAVTPAGTSLYPSRQAEAMLGYPVEAWLDDPELFAKILHPDDRENVLALIETSSRTGKPFAREYRLIARDGRVVWVQDERVMFADEGGTSIFTQGYLLDITARKQSEQRLAAEHGVAHVLGEAKTFEEAAPEILRVVCAAFSWEAGALWLRDRRGEALRRTTTHGTPAADLSADDDSAAGERLACEVWARGEPVWQAERSGPSMYGLPISLGGDLLGVFVFQGRDLREPDENLARTLAFVAVQFAQFVERKQVETQLRHQALHDGLTDLPNRTLFNDRLGQALAAARRSGAPLAVLLMDLDSFKEINDTLGHQSGDALLEDLGQRLEACVRAGDTVARLGGDEFGFLILDVTASGAAEVVDRVRQALAEPFRLHGLTLQVEASVGIALFPEHGESVDELLRHADVAMYVAKRSGAAFSFYDSAEDEHTPIRLAMLGELRRALDEHELVLHY
ncbi:MAG: diguanylate cyclase domain-containing protein, partial [Gaiellaceae bacterium]